MTGGELETHETLSHVNEHRESVPVGMIWQTVTGKGGAQHAFPGASGWSVCGRQSRKDWRDSNLVPSPINLCSICVERVLAATPSDHLPTLPMEILGNTIAVQAFKAFRALNPKARTIADLGAFREDELLEQKGFGLKCLTSLNEALALVGMKPVRGSKKPRRVVITEAALKAQAERFLKEVGLQAIQEWTLQQIGDAVGISRERVRQIFEVNPALKLLRGTPNHLHRRVLNNEVIENLQNLYLEGNTSLTAASRQVGVKPGTVHALAGRHPALASMLRQGRDKQLAKRQEDYEARVIKVAEYALANGTSFQGACKALGVDHTHLGYLKNHLVPHLKQDPRYADILAPEKRIDQDVQIARERILAGRSLEGSCEGLKTNLNTVRRHLDKDPEVMAVINTRGSARKRKP